ncbi:MAG: arsenate reductase ArsC [Alphaproteobacteria bacterium]|nr:arsenate reductase ArsC [Alphaproteobacteria bacterium]
MSDSIRSVLFLCTGNSARSILAECTLNREGQGRFRAFSAGSQPTGKVNPYALELLASESYPVEGYRSKSWDEFSGPDAPDIDYIITVCGNAANEVCPVWPGHPATAHWGVPDPAAVSESEEASRQAFRQAYTTLRNRIGLFLALPFETLERPVLQKRLEEIGTT